MQYKKVVRGMEKDKAETGTVNVQDGCYNTKQGGQGRPHSEMTFGQNIKRDQGTSFGQCVLGREHRIWENSVKTSSLAHSQETVLEYSKKRRMDLRSKGKENR